MLHPTFTAGWAVATLLALPLLAQAAPYDRYDREQRVARGERLAWNTLDDFNGFGADDPDYRGSSVYSWAACMQMVFALAGYETDQAAIINENYGDNWGALSPRSLPQTTYSGIYGIGNRELYLTAMTAPGRLAPEQVIACIDHGNPVVLVVNPGQGRRGDPLLGYRRSVQRLALVHGYLWDTDPQTLVRTLWLDVFDPLPPDGAEAGTVRVPYNQLADAWGATLSGTLDNSQTRLGVSVLSR